MNRTFLISPLSFLLLPAAVFSQNLVPNPSFELFSACPDTFFPPPTGSNVSAANYWYNPGGFTPDYFNTCDSISPYFGVPSNQYGFQYARTGVAYAGIILSFFPVSDIREYIQTRLTDSLRAGKNYIVSFYISLANWSNYATNDIGVYFSTDSFITSSFGPLPYQPQIENSSFTNFLIDTLNWIEVQDTFTAKGGEQYITIGNFKDDANTDTMHMPWFPAWDDISFYYIDDVSVICLDCSVGINDIDYSDYVKIFPNPVTDFISVELQGFFANKITLFNAIGEIILVVVKEDLQNSKFVGIHVTQFSQGVYFLKIEAENLSTVKPFFINH